MNDYMYSEEETIQLAKEGRIPEGAYLLLWDDPNDDAYFLKTFVHYSDEPPYWQTTKHTFKHACLVKQAFLDIISPGRTQPPLLPEKPPRGEPVLVLIDYEEWQYGFLVYPPPDDDIANFYRFKVGTTYVEVFMADTHRWRRLTDEEKQQLGIS